MLAAAPLMVVCASICAGDQYIWGVGRPGDDVTVPFDGQVDVQPPLLFTTQIGKRFGILHRSVDSGCFESEQGYDPR